MQPTHLNALDRQINGVSRSKPTFALNLRMTLAFHREWNVDMAHYHAGYYPRANVFIYIALLCLSPFSRVVVGMSLPIDFISSYILGGYKSEYFTMLDARRLDYTQTPGVVLLAAFLDFLLLSLRALGVFGLGAAFTYSLDKYNNNDNIVFCLLFITLSQVIGHGLYELYENGSVIAKSLCHLPQSFFRSARSAVVNNGAAERYELQVADDAKENELDEVEQQLRNGQVIEFAPTKMGM